MTSTEQVAAERLAKARHKHAAKFVSSLRYVFERWQEDPPAIEEIESICESIFSAAAREVLRVSAPNIAGTEGITWMCALQRAVLEEWYKPIARKKAP